MSACTAREPLTAGEVVPVDIALGPSATFSRWGYKASRRGTCALHWGPDRPAHLLLPVIPQALSVPGGGRIPAVVSLGCGN